MYVNDAGINPSCPSIKKKAQKNFRSLFYAMPTLLLGRHVPGVGVCMNLFSCGKIQFCSRLLNGHINLNLYLI